MKQERKTFKINSYIRMLLFVGILLFMSLILFIAVCLFYSEQFQDSHEEKDYEKYYTMIVNNRKYDFWKSIYEGAYHAGLEKNVYVDLLGNNLAQSYSKEDLLEIAMYSDVDGIIVEADESEEMTTLINRAVEAGIPVVTVNGDNTASKRCSFIGVGNYDLGREYGRQILKLAGGKEKRVAVLVSAHTAGSGQNIVFTGIQETIAQENEEGIPFQLSMITVDDTNAFTVEESIREIFRKSEVPDIIICLSALNTTTVYQAVVDYNKVGEVNILGYYDTETILKGIERNVISATISVDTTQMGRECVEALMEYEELGYTSEYFTADINLINRDNVGEFIGGDTDAEE